MFQFEKNPDDKNLSWKIGKRKNADADVEKNIHKYRNEEKKSY